MGRVRRWSTLRTHDGCSDTRYTEAYLRQRPAEKTVLLVAPSAATPVYDLLVGILDPRRQRFAEQYIEVLKRDVVVVGSQKSAQRVERWLSRAGPTDSLEIRSEPHAANYASVSTRDLKATQPPEAFGLE